MTMTYEHALAAFRNQVNLKFPPQMGQLTQIRRQINEVSGQSQNFARGNVEWRSDTMCPRLEAQMRIQPRLESMSSRNDGITS
jgi:hypothetical protein